MIRTIKLRGAAPEAWPDSSELLGKGPLDSLIQATTG
jgi:hypothetical protein